MKRGNRRAFSLIEVIFAVAIFSTAAATLAVSMANGLLSRRSAANHSADSFECAFAARVIQSSASIGDATRISQLTMPDGEVVRTKVTVTPTDLESLFWVELTLGKGQYKFLLANGNWR